VASTGTQTLAIQARVHEATLATVATTGTQTLATTATTVALTINTLFVSAAARYFNSRFSDRFKKS
jgi:hypothetical protein